MHNHIDNTNYIRLLSSLSWNILLHLFHLIFTYKLTKIEIKHRNVKMSIRRLIRSLQNTLNIKYYVDFGLVQLISSVQYKMIVALLLILGKYACKFYNISHHYRLELEKERIR